MRLGRARLAAAGAVVVVALSVTAAAAAPATPTPTAPTAATPTAAPTPTAPTPTSTAVSPEAPDPFPPAGGKGPGGVVPGGRALGARDVVVPTGSAALPATTTAQAWALVDLDSGTVLAGRDVHGRYQPASILKTLTSLVLLPRLASGTAVPISESAAATEGSAVGLVPGGAYDADILFTAMLLMSGNDATEALTQAAGGDAAVVAAMNSTVRGLGGYDTVVQTPTGLDGWSQLTSAYDMALVLRAAVDDPRLLGYDAVRRAFLPAQSVLKNGLPVGTIEMDNQSTDFLDAYPGALFAKTGFTDAARHTFLAAAARDGRRLGVVLLRAERTPVDQWQQAAALFDWGFARPATASGVGTLEDAATVVARAGSSPTATASTPQRADAAIAPATTASSTSARTVAAGTGQHGTSGWVPLVYGGVAVAFVVVGLGYERLRRRRR